MSQLPPPAVRTFDALGAETASPPPDVSDLVGYLVAVFRVSNPGGDLDQFLAFARKHLTENPPISVAYLEEGLGVVLQNNVRLSFSPPVDSPPQIPDNGFAVTRPRSQPGQSGISDTSSISITNPHSKKG